MKECSWCKQEMKKGITCDVNDSVEYPDGLVMPSTPNVEDGDCHDCNARSEGNHHPGCDMERCPRCGGQLIGCGCLDDN